MLFTNTSVILLWRISSLSQSTPRLKSFAYNISLYYAMFCNKFNTTILHCIDKTTLKILYRGQRMPIITRVQLPLISECFSWETQCRNVVNGVPALKSMHIVCYCKLRRENIIVDFQQTKSVGLMLGRRCRLLYNNKLNLVIVLCFCKHITLLPHLTTQKKR